MFRFVTKILGGFVNFLFKHLPIGYRVYVFISNTAIAISIVNKLKYMKANEYMKAPSKQMLDARKYFKENIDRVDKCASFLHDDESRAVYRSMISFRCNSDPSGFITSKQKHLYFINEYFNYSTEEVLVDCGAYIGDTISNFKKAMKRKNGKYTKIVAFEPDSRCYKTLVKRYKDIIAIKAGVWCKDDKLFFSGDGAVFSVSDESDSTNGYGEHIDVRSIDSCPECEGVTFIKMDIEGAEMEALIGGKNTISKYKPKLAISIYHSDADMIRIIEWVHANFPEYRLFIRQHEKYATNDTVLYAMIV